MSRNFVCLSLLVVVGLLTAPAFGSTLTYNFDGADSPGTWAAISPYVGDSNVVLQVTPTGNPPGYGAQSGTGFVLGLPSGSPAGCYNGATATSTLASPTFQLNGGGDLTFWLNVANTSSLEGETIGGKSVNGVAQLSDLPLTTTTSASQTGGFYGVALLDVNTSTFVLGGTANKDIDWYQSGSWHAGQTTGLGRLGDGWWECRFNTTQLSALNQSHVYQLVFIDQWYAWGEFDTVSIPGTASPTPEPGTLALLAAGLAGLLCYAWRKRR